MIRSYETEPLWQFDTANFRVCFYAEPCQDDPADSFEFMEDIEGVRSGKYDWFNAHVVVYFGASTDGDLEKVGSDVLCCCAYERARDFAKVGQRDYFVDMVRHAIGEARKVVALKRDRFNAVRLRA